MTDMQADHEARQRWGPRGHAWHPPYDVPGGASYCVVGITDGTDSLNRWTPYGVAETWEEAFQDATERGYGPRPRRRR